MIQSEKKDVQEIPAKINKKLARLKAQFEKIKDDFSQFDKFEDLPEQITDIAVQEDIPIFDAILRYMFYQKQLADEEAENQRKNSAAALGKVKNGADENESTMAAMLKGVRSV